MKNEIQNPSNLAIRLNAQRQQISNKENKYAGYDLAIKTIANEIFGENSEQGMDFLIECGYYRE